MTLTQSIKLAQAAKAKGLALEVESGKVRFTSVVYAPSGIAAVTPVTAWLDLAGASKFVGV